LVKSRDEVIHRKAESLQFLRLHRLILDEMAKRYSYIRMPNDILNNILAHLKIDPFRFNIDSVRKVIL